MLLRRTEGEKRTDGNSMFAFIEFELVQIQRVTAKGKLHLYDRNSVSVGSHHQISKNLKIHLKPMCRNKRNV